MTRNEVKSFLEGQLKMLKECHVEDLMKAGRTEELKEIVEELEFSPVEEFCDKKNLNLQVSEIPEGYHYELVLYLSQSKVCDNEFFENYNDFAEVLMRTGEELAKQIATIMGDWDLSNCSIEELLFGVQDEDEKE